MKREYSIELLEEYENVNFYSIKLNGEELTELEIFFEKFPEGCEYDEEMDVIISWLDQIAERGAKERYFRPEGRYGDGVGVIPIEVGNKLRLYCLRLSDKILIFGNGGVKDSRSWQESETLAPYVKLLMDTSRFIASRIKDGTIPAQAAKMFELKKNCEEVENLKNQNNQLRERLYILSRRLYTLEVRNYFLII